MSNAELAEVEHRALDSRAPFGGVTGRPSFYEDHALARERTTRARNALKILAAVGFIGSAVLQVLGDHGATHWIVTGLTLALGIYSVATLRHLDRGARGDANVVHSAGVLGAIVNLAVVAYMGVLTVAALPMVLIVSYRGQLDRREMAWAAYLLCALGYAGLLVLAVVGVLPLTESSPRFATSEPRSILSLGLYFEVVLAVTFALATLFRRSAVKGMRSLQRARQEIAQREALLEEVRFDLEHALDARRLGRFTGQAVGAYLAHDVIGRGASAEVYYAKHRATDEAVALKVLYPDASAQADSVHRLALEATLGERFESPHLVRAFEMGRADDGSPFVAFELVRGRELAETLRASGRLSAADVAVLIDQIAAALGTAHAEGVVHADVNPRNIIRAGSTDDSSWKLLDFGMAHTLDEAGARGPKAGATPAYASPEQAMGGELDRRADVCSLGLVAYRALTGRRPFPGANVEAVLYQAVHVMPPRPGSFVTLSDDLECVLALAIAKDRRQRFQTADEFARAFSTALVRELDVEVRRRAEAVLARAPWDSEDLRAARETA